MEQIAFLHTDTNSGTLKVTLIVIGCKWSNIGMTLGLGTVKSAVSQEWIDELNWCCVCLCKFRKAKSYCNRYGVGVGKYEHGLLGHGTLRSALSQEWIDELSWGFFGFFACNDAVVFG